MEETPDEQEYLILRDGDKIENGDEYLYYGRWFPAFLWGVINSESWTHRRKIEIEILDFVLNRRNNKKDRNNERGRILQTACGLSRRGAN